MAIENHIKTALAELMFSNLSAAAQIEELIKQIAELKEKMKDAQAELDSLKNDPKLPGV